MPNREALQRITSAGQTSIEIVEAIFKEYSSRTVFGFATPAESTFNTLTYGQMWERIQACGTFYLFPLRMHIGALTRMQDNSTTQGLPRVLNHHVELH